MKKQQKTNKSEAEILGLFCVEHHITMEELQKLARQLHPNEEMTNFDQDIHFQRFHEMEGKIVISHELMIDFRREIIKKGKTILPLHPFELLILRLLVANGKETISNDELLHLMKMYGQPISAGSLVTYISRISKRLGKRPGDLPYIRRHWKRGYFWDSPVTVKRQPKQRFLYKDS